MADLGTHRLTWRRLGLLIRHLPDGSATMRAFHGPLASWGVTEHLLAGVVDVLQGANWQRSGGKGRKPKPLDRPKSASEIREKKRRMAAMAVKHAEWKQRRKDSGG